MVQLKIQDNIILPPTKVKLNNAIYSILPKNFNGVLKDLWNINPNNPNEIQATYYIEDNNILAVTATIQPTETPNIYNLIGFKLESEHPIIKEMNEEVNNELFTISPLDEFFIMNAYELNEDLMELDNKIHSTDNDNINFFTALANSKDIYEDDENETPECLLGDVYDDIPKMDINDPWTIYDFNLKMKYKVEQILLDLIQKYNDKYSNGTPYVKNRNMQYCREDYIKLAGYTTVQTFKNLVNNSYTLFYNPQKNTTFFAISQPGYDNCSYTDVPDIEQINLCHDTTLTLIEYFIQKYKLND